MHQQESTELEWRNKTNKANKWVVRPHHAMHLQTVAGINFQKSLGKLKNWMSDFVLILLSAMTAKGVLFFTGEKN